MTPKELVTDVCVEACRYALWKTIPEMGWYHNGIIGFKLTDKHKAKFVEWCNKISNKNERDIPEFMDRVCPRYNESVEAQLDGEGHWKDALGYIQTAPAIVADGKRFLLNARNFATISKYQPTATLRIKNDDIVGWFIGQECVGVMLVIDPEDYVTHATK